MAACGMSGDYTLDELMTCCVSRQMSDGDIVAQGIATPMVLTGYLLAKLTHAPNLVIASAMGDSILRQWQPLSFLWADAIWADRPLRRLQFDQIACELLPLAQPKEFLRPAQVDQFGNFNNLWIGSPEKPVLRLPGCGGIADITTYYKRHYLYVTRHSPRVFVPKVDWISGLGNPVAKEAGPREYYLVSDLGQFDLHEGRIRLTALHPGVSLETVRAQTGFELQVADPLGTTGPPSSEEVSTIREKVDPLGMRQLEFLSGKERLEAIRRLIRLENG
jgi:acyl CoA:acetate/3-ketoacid CoA transferase beta subunit